MRLTVMSHLTLDGVMQSDRSARSIMAAGLGTPAFASDIWAADGGGPVGAG
ncbi:MAG TPA: hypothetical protein VGM14_29945 [Streptosporangiaceae bacterium]|jgi:hypothetical protein